MNLIKPEKLNKGDTIGIIALSGAIESKENILNAKKYFEGKGFKVVLSDNIFDKNRYLAGSDEKKVEELHKFFKNPEIKMILCARGGYGAIRLLDKIDWEIIKNNPKIFAGYSDVSALQAMILKKTGLITFYSPMASSDFGCEEVSKFVEKSFFDTLTNTESLEISALAPSPLRGEDSAERKGLSILSVRGFRCEERASEKLGEGVNNDIPITYFAGEAKGILFGGNLATTVSLCGQDFIPDEKFIFFAEDLGEDTYKIDKMMTQLLNIPQFHKNLTGIILGDFLDVKNKKHFDELFFEIGERYKVPILSGFKITHAKEKITLPYGAKTEFSTEDKILKISPYLT